MSSRALRAQDRALRARVPKKIKTFLRLFLKTFCLRLFLKTFLLASLDGRCDRVSKGCLRGARFARDENLEIFENQKKYFFLNFDRSQQLKLRPGQLVVVAWSLEKLK